MNQIVNKKVNLRLVDLDGNAFSLLGAFKRQAKREGWSQEDIYAVLKECQSGDYDHLLRTLIAHTEDRDGVDDSDEYGGES